MSFWVISKAIPPQLLPSDGKWALTGSAATTARLWDLANLGSSPRVLLEHTLVISSVALTPDGKLGSNWSLPRYDCTHSDLGNPAVVLVILLGIRA